MLDRPCHQFRRARQFQVAFRLELSLWNFQFGNFFDYKISSTRNSFWPSERRLFDRLIVRTNFLLKKIPLSKKFGLLREFVWKNKRVDFFYAKQIRPINPTESVWPIKSIQLDQDSVLRTVSEMNSILGCSKFPTILDDSRQKLDGHCFPWLSTAILLTSREVRHYFSTQKFLANNPPASFLTWH